MAKTEGKGGGGAEGSEGEAGETQGLACRGGKANGPEKEGGGRAPPTWNRYDCLINIINWCSECSLLEKITNDYTLLVTEEKKQRDIEEKRRRLEESEKKRQAMMQAMKDQASKKGPNFTITKKGLEVSTWLLINMRNYQYQNVRLTTKNSRYRATSRRHSSSVTRRKSSSRRRRRSPWVSASSP